MASTTFVDQVTPVVASWLNDVNDTVYEFTQTGAGAVARTAQGKMRDFISAFDFMTDAQISDVQAGTLAQDVTTALQAAIDAGKNVYLPAGNYKITGPLYLDGGPLGCRLAGAGRQRTTITKTTTTVGTGTNTARGATVNDSYAVDAAIILRHANEAFTYFVEISDLGITSHSSNNDYAIYAPRSSGIVLKNLYILYFKYGFLSYDSFLGEFDSVWVDGTGRTSWRGFTLPDDGSGGGTGTTLTFTNCWALRGTGIAWNIIGLTYSSFINCASDNVTGQAYHFETCTGVTVSGCGMEGTTIAAGEYAFAIINSRMHIAGCRGFGLIGNAAACYALMIDSSFVSMQNCRWDDFTTPAGAYNLAIQNGSELFDSGNQFPTNGNSFVSYTSSSRRFITGGTNVLSVVDSNGTFLADLYQQVTVTYSASMTIDSAAGNEFIITATNGTAFTINAPTNPVTGKRLTITLRNSSGGALGAATWNATFKMSAWTNPANGQNRSITFQYNGTNWIQISQTGVDVPN